LATELAGAPARWHPQHSDELAQALEAYAFTYNAPSRRVLEKTGFVLIGSGSVRDPEWCVTSIPRPRCPEESRDVCDRYQAWLNRHGEAVLRSVGLPAHRS
jgi:RimJ/RimL family protein N-acetyltransferase